MKALLTSPFGPISQSLTSHRSAQGVIYGDMIRQSIGDNLVVNYGGKITDYNPYDTMYVYHGNDWGGTLNLFGGMQNYSNVENVVRFSKFKGKIVSLGIDFPPYHELIGTILRRNIENKKDIQPEWHDVDLVNLERMFNEAKTSKYPHITSKIVVGDSHSICMYRPGWTVNSIPFKTLNGILNTGLEVPISDIRPINEVTDAEFYFGNIDVRHHLCRLEGSHVDNAIGLARRYISAVEALPIKNVSIYELLPIENESRVLPKTGYYKGKPFWGTWEERNQARNAFNTTIELTVKRAKFIKWTDGLLNDKGELSFDHMEKPRSIHLARSSYPHWTGEEVNINSLESFFN